MKKANELNVRGTAVRVAKIGGDDFVCLTDIAATRNPTDPRFVVQSWMRNRMTVLFLGLWEELNNPEFNRVGFEAVKEHAGENAFSLSPAQWIAQTNAIGMASKAGRYGGGTYAHSEIAFEFASWVSVEFKLYLVTEFKRLKAAEQAQLGWSAKRELAKINYRIHTDAIQQHLIPAAVTRAQMNVIYANEADVLNVALFGQTHQQWQAQHPDLKGNQRDYADINQLICISNMENLNAVMIKDGISQPQRLKRLNEIAIHQMKILSTGTGGRNLLK